MGKEMYAAHILAHEHPELANDEVSRYARYLKETLGPTKSGAAYSMACRSTPIGENKLGLKRGSVVEIEGEKYLAMGCGFLTLEFTSLDHPGQIRTLDHADFSRVINGAFRVLSEDESRNVLEALMGAPPQ